MMSSKKKVIAQGELSRDLAKIWGFVSFRYLILATTGYIVFIDHELEVDWKSSKGWDKLHSKNRGKFAEVLNRAAEIESADWDSTDEPKTLKFKRQVGEAIARGLDGDFEHAARMLDKAESYRKEVLNARKAAIAEQVQVGNNWKASCWWWTLIHYGVGATALLASSLVASKPTWMGLNEDHVSALAWAVAALTGLLTLLTPDKKADKYMRASSVLNSEITRYNANLGHTVEQVLNAYQEGQNIIYETGK
jgi:hypothetical protein